MIEIEEWYDQQKYELEMKEELETEYKRFFYSGL